MPKSWQHDYLPHHAVLKGGLADHGWGPAMVPQRLSSPCHSIAVPVAAIVLSGLLHAAVLFGLVLFMRDRTPPDISGEAGVAMVFVAAPPAAAAVPDVPAPPLAVTATEVPPQPQPNATRAEPPTTLPPSKAPPVPMPGKASTTDPAVPPPSPLALSSPATPQVLQPPDVAQLTDPPPAAPQLPTPPILPPEMPEMTQQAQQVPSSPASRPVRRRVAAASKSSPSDAAQTQSTATATLAAAAAPLVPPRPVVGMKTNHPPAYPRIARQRGQQGRVTLRVSVAADGHPLEVDVIQSSGHESLDSAALAAVRQWRFTPATRAGVTVSGIADVPIRFRLEN